MNFDNIYSMITDAKQFHENNAEFVFEWADLPHQQPDPILRIIASNAIGKEESWCISIQDFANTASNKIRRMCCDSDGKNEIIKWIMA